MMKFIGALIVGSLSWATAAVAQLPFGQVGQPAPLPLSGGTLTGSVTRLDLPSINVMSAPYNAQCDGSTDDSVAINAAIAALMSGAGLGGQIIIPGGKTCVMLSALALPYTGTAPPIQKPLRITGSMQTFDGSLRANAVSGGSTLDMRYAGGDGTHIAKIDTRGLGLLEVDHLNLIDGTAHGSYSNTLYVFVSNTTLNFHDLHFSGDTSCTGTNCAQNIFSFGGITGVSNPPTNGSTQGFQGYGTQLTNIGYSHIQRAGTFNSAANSIVVTNNYVDYTCGSSETLAAAWIFTGTANGTAGNIFVGGFVEMTNYVYAVAMSGSAGNFRNSFFSFGASDDGVGFLADFYMDANSTDNYIWPGNRNSGAVIVAGAGAPFNLIMGEHGLSTQIPFNTIVGVPNTLGRLTVRGATSGNGFGAIVEINPSGVPGSAFGIFGNSSAILGGAYNADPMLYGAGGSTMHFQMGGGESMRLKNGLALNSTIDPGSGAIGVQAVVGNGAVPTTTGSTCASVGTPVGGNSIGKVVLTCAAATLVLNFSVTAPNGWICNAQDQTTPADTMKQTANTTTSATLTGTTVAGDTILYSCMAF